MDRSMMAQTNLPISFWGDAILTAAYILNRVSSKSVLSTPYEMWHDIWELVDLPSGCKTVGNKWVLKVKRKLDGSINKYKAQLVAKGYTLREGIDYEKIFSPVVRFASIRLILVIVAHLDLKLFQMDVKIAFLNGELDEEIYIDQPIGFQEIGQERKVRRSKWTETIVQTVVPSISSSYHYNRLYDGRGKPLCVCQEKWEKFHNTHCMWMIF
ncbi:hypothetical protein Pfo_020348, partial [Paulownia fortunei]